MIVIEALIENQYHSQIVENTYMKSYCYLLQLSILFPGAPDRSDPFGVDMGMDRGLEEPKFRIPVPDESLWLAKKISDGTFMNNIVECDYLL